MHPIQTDVLSQLMHTAKLTYSQLKPNDIPSNRFAYHLEQLVKEGFIAKEDDGYALTPAGMSLADRVSHGTMAVRLQPHIVTTLCVTNGAGQTALFRHAFQPYLGAVGYPQGRLHYHERIAEAAARELAEKTGLRNVALTHRGMVYITGMKNGKGISRLLTHVFSGSVQGEPLIRSADETKGESFWADPAAFVSVPHMPGFVEITQLLASEDGLFFAEITAEMPRPL